MSLNVAFSSWIQPNSLLKFQNLRNTILTVPIEPILVLYRHDSNVTEMCNGLTKLEKYWQNFIGLQAFNYMNTSEKILLNFPYASLGFWQWTLIDAIFQYKMRMMLNEAHLFLLLFMFVWLKESMDMGSYFRSLIRINNRWRNFTIVDEIYLSKMRWLISSVCWIDTLN